jgi:hypothetical protein
LIDLYLMPTLAVFQLFCGVNFVLYYINIETYKMTTKKIRWSLNTGK